MNNCFFKKNRLLSKRDFSNLRIRATKKVEGSFVFYYQKNDLGYPRLGLSISKKSGNAVERNYIKRKIRENFRYSKRQMKSVDINVVAITKSTNISFNHDLFKFLYQ